MESFKSPLPVESHGIHLTPPVSCDNMCNVRYHGSSLETEHPGPSWGLLTVGILGWVFNQIPDSEKESRYLI